jgi:hypothetical protein
VNGDREKPGLKKWTTASDLDLLWVQPNAPVEIYQLSRPAPPDQPAYLAADDFVAI